MSTLDYVFHGLGTAMQWHNVVFVFLRRIDRYSSWRASRIGPMSGVALLIPITATMTAGLGPEEAATSSIILLAGVYYGAMYGGSTTSILLNTPGESSSVVTTLDGYQMAKQGRAGAALAISAIGSFAAGIISLIGLYLPGPSFICGSHQVRASRIFLLNGARLTRDQRTCR